MAASPYLPAPPVLIPTRKTPIRYLVTLTITLALLGGLKDAYMLLVKHASDVEYYVISLSLNVAIISAIAILYLLMRKFTQAK